MFRIRCPISIKTVSSPETLLVFDYESCAYDEQALSLTAFCGFCALKNTDILFSNVYTPLSYNQVNFSNYFLIF